MSDVGYRPGPGITLAAASAAYVHSLAPTAAQVADFAAAVGTLVPVDLLSGSITATLPTAPADKASLYLYVTGFATGHILTVAAGGADQIETSTGTSATVTRSAGAGQSVWLQYDAANALWRQLPDRLPLSLLDARYDSAGAALAAVGGTPLDFTTPVAPGDIGALTSDAPTFTNTLTGPTAVITTATITNLIATAFKIAAAAGVGKVLTSDSAGNAAWATPTYGAFYASIFGNGSDGAVVLDGVNTYAFATLSGSTYTMSRAMRATTLVVNAGITLDPAGYRVFATTSVTVAATGFIRSVGNNGTAAGVAGAATAAGSSVLGTGFAGGAGNTGAGSAGGGTTSIGAPGGAGGAGSGGAAGAAGTTASSQLSYFDQPQVLMVGVVSVAGSVKSLQGGAGGGGGGGDGTNKGGGGGGGGPIVAVFAPVIINNGTIQSQGGNGGTPTTGNCGGGGAGAPGAVLTYSLSAVSGSGTINSPTGTPGSGVGTGANGSNSSTGTSRQVLVQ